jgi:hypothetical protein
MVPGSRVDEERSNHRVERDPTKLDAVVFEDQQVMFRVLTGLRKRLVLEQWLDELEHSTVGLGAPL